jgi:hypothetical protein
MPHSSTFDRWFNSLFGYYWVFWRKKPVKRFFRLGLHTIIMAKNQTPDLPAQIRTNQGATWPLSGEINQLRNIHNDSFMCPINTRLWFYKIKNQITIFIISC